MFMIIDQCIYFYSSSSFFIYISNMYSFFLSNTIWYGLCGNVLFRNQFDISLIVDYCRNDFRLFNINKRIVSGYFCSIWLVCWSIVSHVSKWIWWNANQFSLTMNLHSSAKYPYWSQYTRFFPIYAIIFLVSCKNFNHIHFVINSLTITVLHTHPYNANNFTSSDHKTILYNTYEKWNV